MSEHASSPAATSEPVTLETGLEALQSSPEFRGPVEDLDGHHCNDHFAQIYETAAERFAAAVPFVRHGLERDERVLYVVDESTEAAVRAALRDADIDVDAARNAGQLSFHAVRDTYLRNGTFDPDEMVGFYADTVAEATAEHEALRIVAETTWLQDDATSFEQFMEYEAKVNDLFADEDCLALCQYDRNEFPPEIVRNIIQTHPHLIYDGMACHNVYYTPPTEFFGDEPARENDRMLRTLRERTEAKMELANHEHFIRESYRVTTDSTLDFEQKLEHLLELGCERFDLEMAGLNHLPSRDGEFRLEKGVGLDVDPADEPLWTNPSEGCFCRRTIDAEEPVGMANVRGTNWQDDRIHREFGITSYLGTKVTSGSASYGTLWFGSTESRDRPFSERERTLLELIGQWVSYELERREHNDAQRALYEIASDPDRSFDEKLDALFELGCEQFGLDFGAMATVDPDEDLFEVEYVSGDHDHFEPGLELPLSETYCTAATDTGGVGSVDDPVEAGYDDIYVHNQFGIRTYLGTYIEVEGDANRTFFFVSEDSNHGTFSADERTFQQLLGQWVKYELEREVREAELRRTKKHFERVFENSHDATFIVDPEADEVIDANPAASEMLGYTRDELLSCGPSDLHPDELDGFHAFADEVVEDGGGWTDELTYRTKDRGRIPAEISASQIEYDDRTVMLAAVRDITERKRREQLLVAQKELLERIASGAPLEECLSALCAAVSRLNSGVRASILLADDECEAFEHSIAPDFPASWDEGLEGAPINDLMIGTCGTAVFRGEPITCEDVTNDDRWSKNWREACVDHGVLAGHSEPILDADGTPEGSFMLCFDEPREPNEWERQLADFGTHVAGVALERDRSRQTLRERTEHLSALIETTPDCIKTVAADGTLLQMNSAGLDMVEADAESDVVGECIYDLIPPEHRDQFRAFNERICAGERDTLEFDIIGLEGTRRHMESHAAPLHRPDGTTSHVAVTRDITERKEREEHLEQKTDRLESFASMLAHELRNPTMIGQIYSQQLLDDADSEAVEYVTEAFDRIEDMIDVMLVLTRGSEAVGERIPVELADVAEQAWVDVDAPDATLNSEIDEIIEADETYIQHLLQNLLENAVEHGGADVAVTVGDLPDGFYVADDGPGIPPEDRDAVFDEGYTTAADNGGTGLGLAFVQKLAEVYEWDYAVTESAAGGARFEFRDVD